MAKRLIEDEMDNQDSENEAKRRAKNYMALKKTVVDSEEYEAERRMNIIAQNGNTGEHYDGNKKTVYALDITQVLLFQDILDIIDSMGMQLTISSGNFTEAQQSLVDKGIFKKIDE